MGWGMFAAGQAVSHHRHVKNQRRRDSERSRRERQQRAAARDRRVRARQAEAQREAVREARAQAEAEARQKEQAARYHAEREAAWEDTIAKQDAAAEKEAMWRAQDIKWMQEKFTPEQQEQIRQAREGKSTTPIRRESPEEIRAAQQAWRERQVALTPRRDLIIGKALVVFVIGAFILTIVSGLGYALGGTLVAEIAVLVAGPMWIYFFVQIFSDKKTDTTIAVEEEPLPVIIGSEPKQDK